MAELIHKLRPHVTAFSATVPKQEHGDTVTVGGKVIGILNMTDILKDSKEEYRDAGVYITIDDELGETQLCLAPKAYDIYIKSHGELHLGDIILAEGRVHRLDTTHSYEGARGKTVTVDKHEQETIRVLSYQVKPLPEDKTKKVVAPKAE